MGEVLLDLSRVRLPDREAHNSRMFIDLCENIHIHYREFRIVFSLDEYFEFVDILQRSTEDVRNYLAQNPDYEEQKYGTTLMFAGGKERQKKLLENSPQPNRSKYFSNHFGIELQAESVVDEIHVHWRDYRLALPREHFKKIAGAFEVAAQKLEEFEKQHNYERKHHRDRTMEAFEEERRKYKPYETGIVDEATIRLDKVHTRFSDIVNEFNPDSNAIKHLINLYKKDARVFPILLSTEQNGEHHIIDGNHRFFAAKKAGKEQINCIISDITFEQSESFRKAESLLKKFDRETGYKYHTSGFNREFFCYKMGRFYKDHFYRKTKVRYFAIRHMKTIPGLYRFVKWLKN